MNKIDSFILLLSMFTIISLICLYALYKHILKRNYFPIKERSGWMTFLMGLNCYLLISI